MPLSTVHALALALPGCSKRREDIALAIKHAESLSRAGLPSSGAVPVIVASSEVVSHLVTHTLAS